MDINNRILIKDEGPFKRGLEFNDEAIYYLLGDTLLAFVDFSNDNSVYEKLSKISVFTETINVKFEILTSIHFSSLDSNLLKNIELYYICYEGRIVQMDYLNFRNGEEYDNILVEKILFDILPTQRYPWLNLKGTKNLDSNIHYLKADQTETIGKKLCFKYFNDSHPLLDRLILEPVLND